MNNRKARALIARTFKSFNFMNQMWFNSLTDALDCPDNAGHFSAKVTVKITEQCPWTGNLINRYRTVM